MKACFQAPPEDTPESAAFLEIHAPAGAESARDQRAAEKAAQEARARSRSVRMACCSRAGCSHPRRGFGALEHPTYDVWVISCSTSAVPVASNTSRPT